MAYESGTGTVRVTPPHKIKADATNYTNGQD